MSKKTLETGSLRAVSDTKVRSRTGGSRNFVKVEHKSKSVDETQQATGATRAAPAEDLDPGRERRPLESYFQEIGGTRTLRREEEVLLAKELEAATADLRDALYSIPLCARHVVARWDELRALSHTGAKLSESVGDEETGEIAARVERAVKRLRTLLQHRDKARDSGNAKELAQGRRAHLARDEVGAALARGARRDAPARARPLASR